MNDEFLAAVAAIWPGHTLIPLANITMSSIPAVSDNPVMYGCEVCDAVYWPDLCGGDEGEIYTDRYVKFFDADNDRLQQCECWKIPSVIQKVES